MVPEINLSKGNSKIHKALIWNLPSGITCPGATKLCKQICYAKDAEVFRKNTVPQSRAKNLVVAKRPDFKDLMTAKLKKALIPQVRIHESGDFFNQKYLNAWIHIIKDNPDKTFWAYTKSYKLDFSEALKLKNLYLRYSVDCTTTQYPEQKIPVAAASQVRDDLFICPSTLAKGHTVKCMLDCSFCKETRKGLIFRPHGRNAKKVGAAEACVKSASK